MADGLCSRCSAVPGSLLEACQRTIAAQAELLRAAEERANEAEEALKICIASLRGWMLPDEWARFRDALGEFANKVPEVHHE